MPEPPFAKPRATAPATAPPAATPPTAPPAVAPPAVAPLAAALIALREAAAGVRFRLTIPGVDGARATRDELVHQLDDYVLPRLARLDAPLLTVIGGSTGAGKSTIVNSLVRAPVSPSGLLRPTTRSPVLVCHPDDVAWFSDTRVLPELTRTSGAGTDQRTLQLVTAPSLDPGLAFLDAPDIDSVVAANRTLAAQLLAAADLWLFVTTAARYADAVPWDVLQTAESRGTALAVLLDRVPPGAEADVGAHLAEMLKANGLGSAPLFVVPETGLQDGMLPEAVVEPLRTWFRRLARDAEQRAAVVRRTLDGALDSLRPRAAELTAQATAQRDAARRLREEARSAYAGALTTVDDGMRDGTLLRGEVLARWQEFVGTGELLRGLQSRVGRWRDQLAAAVTGRPRPATDLTEALESGVALLLHNAAAQAAEDVATSWRSTAAGAALLRAPTRPDDTARPENTARPDDTARSTGTAALERPSPQFRAAAEQTVRDWQSGVLDLVRREGGDRRTTARIAAYGVNASGLLVMIAVFTTTSVIAAPLEVAVAGGTTLLSQKVLEALFGDQAVRSLADTARADLLERAAALLGGEEERYAALLDELTDGADEVDRLARSAAAVERAR